mmetsp:Transcript_29119/g.71037  ORF Transcript_29119/g.71037 Transcript_29119/m.71037 type:complete len:187 (+) Transcript_29119:85-645(+)
MMSKIKGWPREIEFSSDNDWSKVPEEVQKRLRPRQNNPRGKACRIVRIKEIDDKSHPAYQQRGLFAATNIKPNTHIIDYVGKIRLESEESKNSDYIIAFTENLSIDAEKFGNEARFINDFRGTGGTQNVKFDTYASDGGTRLGVFSLSKQIKKGEELLVTYGRGFWKERGLFDVIAKARERKSSIT